MAVKTKRVYEPASGADGYRILVDRLWPRGLKKEEAQLDKWLKEVAPSTALRKWFNHTPEKWKSFITKYRKELSGSPALEELKAENRKHKTVTLLFGAKDEQHNQAMALLQMLNKTP